MTVRFVALLVLLLSVHAVADSATMADLPMGYPVTPEDCEASEMLVYDPMMGMCMPLAMAGMPMRMLMLSGNVFGGYTAASGPRGRDAWWSTSMVMLDIGTSVGDRHYVNLDLMGTAEKWTLPEQGYPLLLQIGEENENHMPFLDAQHPHSSPLMGITLSDTIRLGEDKDFLKIFFAPRGESTDGPIAFMHRPTGVMNPDAPLGHHIGQDVGHISSTVIGASLKIGATRFEASTFNGREPEPTKVDLPIGAPDSFAVRVIEMFSDDWMAMASAAYVSSPEPDDMSAMDMMRYSASVYNRWRAFAGWTLDNALIYGAITHMDQTSLLSSFAEEAWLHHAPHNVWGRIEVLQRTPAELEIPGSASPNSGAWVAAVTLGYTYNVTRIGGATLGIGASVTKDFLPSIFSPAYGGNPWSAKAFLQVKGMRMWDL